MRITSKFLICILLFQIVSKQTFAWGKKGHELIAQIAFHFLDDSTKKIVKGYLGKMSIEEAANWMDDEKSNSYYNYMRTWHYINMEKGENYTPSTERNILSVLHSAILDLRNYKTASKKDIKRDLLLIFHLMGDLHQPLHCGYGSDRGGNSVDITSPVASGNLHSVWDSQVLDYKGTNLDTILSMYSAEEMNKMYHNIDKVNELSWMKSSRGYLDSAYAFPNGFLSYQYIDWSYEVMKKQILLGGMRLAFLLKEAFNPEVTPAVKS